MSSAPGEFAASPRKIAVLRANAIGDFVFSLPALDALRARFPGAEIVLLGLPWHERFLRERPTPADRVVPLPPIRGVGAPEEHATDERALDECVAALRAERFDLGVQIHGGGRHSNPFLRALEPRHTIGLRAPGAAALDRWIPYVYWQPEILRMLEVVALAGARPVTLRPQLAVTERDRAAAAATCDVARERLIVIHPGAGDPRRRWPLERFVETGKALLAAGFELAVVGGNGDRALADALVAGLEGHAANLAGRLSLGGSAALFERARLFIGNDSGPLHIAEAVGTPTVGVYWCGNLVNADPMTRAIHRPVLSWRVECPVCGTNVLTTQCPHDASFVDLASVGEVLAHAFELLTGDGFAAPPVTNAAPQATA